jgi:hypothetical protein
MRHKISLSICCLMFSANSLADISDIKAANNQAVIQTISTNVNYTETGNGIFGSQTGTLDTETGSVPGYALSISTMIGRETEYFAFEYDHSSGNTNYTGALQGGTFGSIVSTSGAVLTNYRLRAGNGYGLNDKFMLTPYLELGVHEWDRGVNYGETYTHKYFGIGALGQFSPVYKLVLSANAMAGKTFGSYITVNSGPGLNGFSGSLGNSTLYRAGLSADYAFMEHFHGNIGVDYTSFSYGMSGVYPVGSNTVAWEPDSKTNYTTLRLGVGYAF